MNDPDRNLDAEAAWERYLDAYGRVEEVNLVFDGTPEAEQACTEASAVAKDAFAAWAQVRTPETSWAVEHAAIAAAEAVVTDSLEADFAAWGFPDPEPGAEI